MTTLELPQPDPADIIVKLRGMEVVGIDGPPGLSVQVRDFSMVPSKSGDLCRDAEGYRCTCYWITEPGAANTDERISLFPPSARLRVLQCSSAHITGRDSELLKDASGFGVAMILHDLATWPPVWEKNNPDMSGGWWIATTDVELAAEPVLMAGASPALRQLWRDAQAAGFDRIELDQDAPELPGRPTFEW